MSQFNPSAPDHGGANFELVPEGAHAARCARVIEVGIQDGGGTYPDQNKAVVVLSLPNVMMELNGEQKQRFISQPYGINLSNNKNSSMQQYTKALNPKASCLGDFLGCACQVNIIHAPKKQSEGFFDKIDSVAPLMAGLDVPPLDTEPYWFEWNNPSADIWTRIPEFTQNIIKSALNYPGSYVEEMVLALDGGGSHSNDDNVDDDIPL